jgi:signal transduction histidine kinase
MDPAQERSPPAPEGTPRPPDPPARLERIEHLLGQLRPVIGHDLSNQLVAVRGLLQVLHLEEGTRLSADGQDYLQRASAATERAQALVSALKEVASLASERPPAAESVALADLLGEVVAAARQLAPASRFECRLGTDADRVWAVRRLLHQALARLLRLAPAGSDAPRRVGIRSRRVEDRVELTVAEPPEADHPSRPFPGETPGPGRPGDRLDWLLLGELAAQCGGSLGACLGPGGALFTLTLPIAE